MALATLTSKGQVTIPKAVRDSLRLHPGDKLDFLVTDDGEAVLRAVTKRVDDVFGKLHRPSRKAVPVERMDSAINRKMRKSFR